MNGHRWGWGVGGGGVSDVTSTWQNPPGILSLGRPSEEVTLGQRFN